MPEGTVSHLAIRAAGREPPQAFGAERAFAAALLLPDADLAEMCSALKPEHFADPLHGRIFEAAGALVASGQKVNPFTLAPIFKDDDVLIAAGGVNKFFMELARAADGLVRWPDLAQQIVECHALRQLLERADSIIAGVMNPAPGATAADLAATAADELRALSSSIGTAQRGGLPLKYWSDVTEVVAPDRLVHRLLGEGKMAVVYGLPKCGKSFLVSHLAMCLALGWSFFDRKVLRGACLYVAAEGASGMTNRIAAFRLHHGLSESDNGAVPFAIVPVAVNLGPQGADVPRVIAAAQELGQRTGAPVRVIVLDTLARVMPGADENSAGDMGMTIAHAEKIKNATGATIIIVHHSGKAQGAGMRGSSALLGAVDTVVAVEKLASGERAATVEAQRDGADGDVFNFRLEPVIIGQDDDGGDITSAVVVATDAQSTVAAKPRRREPAGKAGLALRALQRALDDAGEAAPTTNHIPRGARVVSTDLWREYAYKMMPEDKADTRRKSFTRGYEALIGSGHACSWGSHAWIP